MLDKRSPTQYQQHSGLLEKGGFRTEGSSSSGVMFMNEKHLIERTKDVFDHVEAGERCLESRLTACSPYL
jgi:hypothetical protein